MVERFLCIGCGWCCWRSPCELAARRFDLLRSSGPCEALVFADGRHWCGVVLAAAGAERRRLEVELFVGAGCCMPDNPWRAERIVDRSSFGRK